VVEAVGNQTLYLGEIHHHTILVEFFRTTVNGDQPIVSMKLLALAFVGKVQLMTG
jgi:hypothetical protein